MESETIFFRFWKSPARQFFPYLIQNIVCGICIDLSASNFTGTEIAANDIKAKYGN